MTTHTRNSGSVYIETYGCQMNRADSEIVMSLLEEQGYSRADSPDSAGFILVNTCIVREHAEEKAISNIAHFKRYKENNPDLKVGVLGCMATSAGENLAKRLPFLDWVLGPDAYRQLPTLMQQPVTGGASVITAGPEKELYDEVVPARRDAANAWVVITRGCNNHCTYCVVPRARGPERYRPLDSVIQDVQNAVADGFAQVSLLGQNVNSWQDGDLSFAQLLSAVADVEGVDRVRFMTSHPKDCSDELLETMGNGGAICPELHLPLQAGSDRILRLMNRRYTAIDYLKRVERARDLVPGVLISTDIIVGFPGESEEEFQKTVDVVDAVGYDDAYVYRYSERPGTAAAKLEDDVPEDEKIRRLTIIGDMVRESGKRNRLALIGKILPLMVEGPSAKNPDELMGRLPAGHVAVFPGRAEPGTVVNVKLTELRGFTLRGEQV